MRSSFACLCCSLAAAVPVIAQNSSAPYAFWTFAGRAVTSGSMDGTGTNARFNRPWGIAVDAQGNVYVSDAVDRP